MGYSSYSEDIQERSADDWHMGPPGEPPSRSVWMPVKLWKQLAAKLVETYQRPPQDALPLDAPPPVRNRPRRTKKRRRQPSKQLIREPEPGRVFPVLSKRERDRKRNREAAAKKRAQRALRQDLLGDVS
jgi:hypothetical protein